MENFDLSQLINKAIENNKQRTQEIIKKEKPIFRVGIFDLLMQILKDNKKLENAFFLSTYKSNMDVIYQDIMNCIDEEIKFINKHSEKTPMKEMDFSNDVKKILSKDDIKNGTMEEFYRKVFDSEKVQGLMTDLAISNTDEVMDYYMEKSPIEDNNNNNNNMENLLKLNKSNDNEIKELVDLTKLCKNKKEIIGREKEIEQMVQILHKKDNNNILLLGKENVGKRSIIEKFIKNKDSYKFLNDYDITKLDINKMKEGCSLYGDIEKKFNQFYLKIKNKKLIIVIDQTDLIFVNETRTTPIHLLLMPLFEMKNISVIATADYKILKEMENNKSFINKFQKITTKELAGDELHYTLKKELNLYREHYNITISDELIPFIVEKTNRYIQEPCFPLKALNIIDEACAKIKLDKKAELTEIDILDVIEKRTGIPANKLSNSEKKKTLNITEKLKERIIGQDQTIEKINSVIKRSVTGISDPKRPQGSFLFLGKSGVGKTEVAKQLATELFGLKDKMIRFDMSEYMDRSSLTNLIGSSMGYVDNNKGGLLTNAIKEEPYSVILLDEIEKAHPDILNILLQVLDEGHLTDGLGEKVNFKNTIIIMTSNLGAEHIGKKYWFKNTEKVIMNSVKNKMRIEFLNRIDEIIIFNNLTYDNLVKIAKIYIEELKIRLQNQNYYIDFDDNCIDLILNNEVNTDFGARPIKRNIQQIFESFIAQNILEDKIKEREKYKINKINNQLSLIKC